MQTTDQDSSEEEFLDSCFVVESMNSVRKGNLHFIHWLDLSFHWARRGLFKGGMTT